MEKTEKGLQPVPIQEPPVPIRGFEALERAVEHSKRSPVTYERLSGQWALFLLSLRSLWWVPATTLTTGGLLSGLFLFYVGHRMGPLASLALGSIGVSVVVWTFASAAVTTSQLVAIRMKRGSASVGYFRSLRLLLEHRTGTLRRLATWVFLGWVGFWLFNISVVGSSIVGLAGETGRTLLGALLGVQVLLTLFGLVWIGLIFAALTTQPTLSLSHPSSREGRERSGALLDAWRIWGPESSARRPLMAMTGGLMSLILGGGGLLAVGYRLVLELDRSIAGPRLAELLGASPLAGLLGIPLAAEPSLSLQVAGITATVSLAGVTGLLLGLTSCYWGLAGHVLKNNPGFKAWQSQRSRSSQATPHTKKTSSTKRPPPSYDGTRR